MKKAFVVVNEQHNLFPEQETILRERFDEIEMVKVPASGWTLEEMKKVAAELHYRASEAEVRRHPETGKVVSTLYSWKTENAVVFASPVPFLMKELAQKAIAYDWYGDYEGDLRHRYDVLVFHNDRREKKELPDGRIIQTVAATGWKLV